MNLAARNGLLAVLVVLTISGCASSRSGLDFEPGAIESSRYVPKVDQFVVIADGSLSMAEPSRGQTKHVIAERLLASLNATIPDLEYEAGLRTFGRGLCGSQGPTVSIVDLGSYIGATYGEGIERYGCSNGYSPLDRAMEAAGSDLVRRDAPTAVIVVSDGLHMGRKEIAAASTLRDSFSADFSLFAIHVGNEHRGRELLDRVVEAGGDGRVVEARDLTTAEAMRDFVVEALLWPDADGDGVPDHLDACPDTPTGVPVDASGCPLDSDGDGVPDYLDQCPDTPAGTPVDARGCPLDGDGDGVPDHLDECPGTASGVPVGANGCPKDSDGDGVSDPFDRCPRTPRGTPVDSRGCPLEGIEVAGDEWFLRGKILFDLNRATIKPDAQQILLRIANFLIDNPQYEVEIQGNTDGSGPLAWNMELSRLRAEAVREFLIINGVERARLTTRAFGPHEPIAPNTTAEGRAKNRRVDFKPTAR
jgi:OOP family OmpA-OmpF porin